MQNGVFASSNGQLRDELFERDAVHDARRGSGEDHCLATQLPPPTLRPKNIPPAEIMAKKALEMPAA